MTLDTAPVERITVFSEPVIVRQSTDIVAIEDESVAAAIRYIRLFADKIESVEEVADSVHLSLRQLQKRFRRNLGVHISEEIRRVRMAKVAELLTETNLPISKIAAQVGYESPKNMEATFRKHIGYSLSGYRKQHTKLPNRWDSTTQMGAKTNK